MALQYWHALERPQKSRLLTLRGGYHGDTFGAMAVSDPVNGMHSIFAGLLPKHIFVPRPKTPFGQPLRSGDIDALAAELERYGKQIAAVILEPIVQGAGGMWFYSADYLVALASLCEAHGVLLIVDEIATGFGRTGRMFASEHAGITPDILCLGKALTGGYLSMAATLTSQKVSDVISSGDGVLMHGPTFMGNPLAAAVAVASLDLLLTSPWLSRVTAIETQLREELGGYTAHPAVAEVRVLGAIGVIETKHPVPVARGSKSVCRSRCMDSPIWQSDLSDAPVRHRRRRPVPTHARHYCGARTGRRLSLLRSRDRRVAGRPWEASECTVR